MLLVEGVFVILTGYKSFSYRHEMNPTITVLARDSIVYFLIIFVCYVLDFVEDIDVNFELFDFSIPTMCISIIAVSRMMMNIRGLIMEDPEHTIHLRSLEFAACTNPGSEMEMAEME